MARPAIAALDASERGLHSLLGVMQRGRMLPDDEILELTEAASRSAAAMTATAAQVVSMERTAEVAPESRAYLAPTINAFTAQLNSGVRQYNEMVTAAAQLVSSANTGSMSSGLLPECLSSATGTNSPTPPTDCSSWAQAFEELDQLR